MILAVVLYGMMYFFLYHFGELSFHLISNLITVFWKTIGIFIVNECSSIYCYYRVTELYTVFQLPPKPSLYIHYVRVDVNIASEKQNFMSFTIVSDSSFWAYTRSKWFIVTGNGARNIILLLLLARIQYYAREDDKARCWSTKRFLLLLFLFFFVCRLTAFFNVYTFLRYAPSL